MTLYNIPILNEPLQTITFKDYEIRIYAYNDNGELMADIYRQNMPLVLSVIVILDKPIIPYSYLADGNNFLITSSDETEARTNWQQLDVTQRLYYASI